MNALFADIAAVAAAEFKIARRNRWAALAALIMMVFAAVLSFVGGAPGGATHVDRLTLSVANLAALSLYLTPLIALLISFESIAGEIDRGTLSLLLATPAPRHAIVAGKFLGALAALSLAIIIGFGAPGLVVYFTSEGGDLVDLARLIATSILLGAAFLAVGILVSAFARTSALAAGLAVGAWLVLVVLFDLALLGALVADNGGAFSREVFPYLLVANPADAFRLYNLSALDLGGIATGLAEGGDDLPFPIIVTLVSIAGWTVIVLACAFLVFRRIKP